MRRQKDFPREVHLRHDAAPWRIRFVLRIKPDVEDGDHPDELIDGLTLPDSRLILIRKGLKPFARLETFVHELVHAAEEDYGFEVPHWLVHKLEKPLAYLLWNNCSWLLFDNDEGPASNEDDYDTRE